jgi:Cu-Zn family superoxide dismutase
MNKLMVVGLSLALSGGFAAAKGKPTKAPEHKGEIEAKSGSTIKGTWEFTQKGKEVTLTVKVTGAPEGEHAVHLHETGDCSDPDAKKAGGHWNPMADMHGAWAKEHHHLGDVGNMKVGKDGKGEITLTTDKWTIGTGEKNDVLGHAIVVHEKIDDFTTQPTGNAGSRIGCAVIPAGEAAATGGGGDGSGGGKGTGGGGGKGSGGGKGGDAKP